MLLSDCDSGGRRMWIMNSNYSVWVENGFGSKHSLLGRSAKHGRLITYYLLCNTIIRPDSSCLEQ